MEKSMILTLLLFWYSLRLSWSLPIQIPGQRREPFQYWLPVASHRSNNATGHNSTSESHKTLFLGEPLIASANSINPRGFDFMKLLVVKRPVHVMHTRIVPLVWVDLPLFDTPTFGNLEQASSTTHKSSNFSFERDSGETSTIAFDEEIVLQEEPPTTTETNNNPRRNSLETKEAITLEKPTSTNEKKSRNEKSLQIHKINWSSLLHPPTTAFSRVSIVKEQKPATGDPLVAESRNQEAHRNTLASQPTSIFPQTVSNIRNKVEPTNSPISPSYNFSYEVSDKDTGDVKSHKESRQGDTTTGEYSVLEPDGYTRVVTYTADSNGFRAIVKRVPPT